MLFRSLRSATRFSLSESLFVASLVMVSNCFLIRFFLSSQLFVRLLPGLLKLSHKFLGMSLVFFQLLFTQLLDSEIRLIQIALQLSSSFFSLTALFSRSSAVALDWMTCSLAWSSSLWTDLRCLWSWTTATKQNNNTHGNDR